MNIPTTNNYLGLKFRNAIHEYDGNDIAFIAAVRIFRYSI